MTARRALLTGANGFIGRALTHRLAADGWEVHGVSRHAAENPPAGVTWHAAELVREAVASELVEQIRPQVVFHLASLVTGRRDVELVLPTLEANLMSTVRLLVAAERQGIERFVLAGSMEEPQPGEPPSSPYSAAKGAASVYAQLFQALYGLPVVTARIFMVYGPGQRDLTKLVPASILAAMAGERPKISSGSRRVDWIFVDDVVDGLVALATSPATIGRRLDLGSGSLASVREVAEEICSQLGVAGPEVGALPDRPLEPQRRADLETTFEACGFRARVGLEQGIARTIAWLRADAARSPVSG